MTIYKEVASIIVVGLVIAAVTAVMSTPVSAQTCINKVISIVDYSPHSAVVGRGVPLQILLLGACDWSNGQHTSGPEDGAYVTFSVDGVPYGPYVTDINGLAVGPQVTYSTAGTHYFTVAVVDDQNNQHVTTSGTFPVSVSGGATPTPQVTVTPQATPIVTIVTPTSGVPTAQPTTVVYPPSTVINQYFPGTVTTGTNPATGDPAIQVTNRPSSTKLQTTLIDFASDPAKNTANFNQATQTALNNGYTLTAKGERTYSDPSQDYRYARFVKGGNTLSLQAIGNNSTNRMNGIPGDILLSQTDETFDSGGLFGLSQLATWALFIVIAVAVLALIIGLVWYRRRGREDEDRPFPQYQQ